MIAFSDDIHGKDFTLFYAIAFYYPTQRGMD
jgi:hypothetical protein